MRGITKGDETAPLPSFDPGKDDFAEEGCGTPVNCDGVDRRRGRPCPVGGENPWRCGLGVELVLLLPALLWLHRRRGLWRASASPPS